MTKVIISPDVLQYRQAMAELVHQVCRENEVTREVRQYDEDLVLPRTEIVDLGIPALLRPPKIEMIWPALILKDGHLDGIIQIHTSEYFGVMNVYVILEDERGNHLESDYAMDNEYVENHWGYIASAPASPGTTILVRAIALDRLGGIAIQTERITV